MIFDMELVLLKFCFISKEFHKRPFFVLGPFFFFAPDTSEGPALGQSFTNTTGLGFSIALGKIIT